MDGIRGDKGDIGPAGVDGPPGGACAANREISFNHFFLCSLPSSIVLHSADAMVDLSK